MILNKLAALKNKKGFTLIEIIVVLVILAVLAAAAVPSMLGFVEEARGKAFIAEARVGIIAAQAVVTELRGSGAASSISSSGVITSSITTLNNSNIINHTTFNNMTKDVGGTFTAVVLTGDQVTGITYDSDGSDTNGYIVRIADGGTTVAPD